MRILTLHAPYFRDRWRRHHDVLAWGPGAHCDLPADAMLVGLGDVLARLPRGWEPDLIVYGDDSWPLRVIGLEDAPCPTVMLAVDVHHHGAWQAPLARAFDAAFVAQRDWLPGFASAGATHARWLPLWAPDDLPEPSATAQHAVAFVGALDPARHPDRGPFLAAVGARLPLHIAEGPYADVFRTSRIVLNQSVKGELNARVFEAMACGALLLTERGADGLGELFRDGEELATYPRGDVEAAVRAATALLADEPRRAAIAARGRARVRAEHLASHRADAVLAAARAAQAGEGAPTGGAHAGAARAYALLADRIGRLATVTGRDVAWRGVREGYLHAATAVALGGHVGEPERSAVLGLVALERGEVSRAAAQLAWVVDHGGGLEDRVAHVEALVRCERVREARDAATALAARHPEWIHGPHLLADLARLEGEAA